MRGIIAALIAFFLSANGAVCVQAQPPSDPASDSQRDVDKEKGALTPPKPISGEAKTASKGDSEAFDWSKVVIPGLFTLIGSIAVVLFQKHSLERTIAAQREGLNATIAAQLRTAADKLQAEAEDKRVEVERKRSSLVTAIATDAIFIGIRAGAFAGQVLQYGDVAKSDLERLRIEPSAALTISWENAYLLKTPAVQAQVKLVTSVIGRVNRRLSELEWLKNDRPTLPLDECKDALEELSDVFRQCASQANGLVRLLKEEFPDYREAIEAAEGQAQATPKREALVSKIVRRRVAQSTATD